MNLITLKELCIQENITRRTIQGYETAGLIQPSSKTKRGYLLYDLKAQERVRKIHMYQKFGFSIQEIQYLMDVSEEILKKNLLLKQNELVEKEKDLEQTILVIKKYIKDLNQGE